MKKILNLLIVAALFSAGLHLYAQTTNAPSTNAAPLVITPVSQTILAPATGTLTAAQVTALQTQLAAAGITFSGGQVRSIQVVLPATLTATAVAHYAVTFYPSTH
jgi:hypothetical protein